MVEYSVELLQKLQTKQEALFFEEDVKEALELYIPPQMSLSMGNDKPKDAEERINDWLRNREKQCLLLLGDSGAGKTLFAKWLTVQIWKTQRSQCRIPLFIPLLYQKNPHENLIDNYLRFTCEIEDENQREWIKQQPLLLILDGFDEIHQKINLYQTNKLWQFKDIKIIISCRSQALAQTYNYASLFYPYDNQGKPQNSRLEEFVVNLFSEKQIDAYLEKYVSITKNTELEKHQNTSKNPDWRAWLTYKTYIENLPGLQPLLTSPFVLSIAVKVLPSIVAELHDKKSIEKRYLLKSNLYDRFVEQWFDRQEKKLLEGEHISKSYPIKKLFKECCKTIANAMLRTKVNSIKLEPDDIVPLLDKHGFFNSTATNIEAEDVFKRQKYFDEGICINGETVKLSFILSGCPVVQLQKNQYAFLHASLIEYFAAEKLFEGVMIDASISLNALNDELLVDEPETITFLANRVIKKEKFKQRLFALIEESKHEERIETASANAITILNYAGIPFSRKNFSHIRIKGADLSNAILDSVNLKNADLRKVNLRGAWLNNAELGGALMEEVEFGEFSYLNAEEPIRCIAYSYFGDHYLAVGGKEGVIRVWNIKESKWVFTLKGHTDQVNCLVFSHDGKILLSGSNDNSIRIWDIVNNKLLCAETKAHRSYVNCVAFSADGKLVASGSQDKSVRLWKWDGKNINPLRELNGHTDKVNCVAFNPEGKILASGSSDKSIRLWDTSNYELLKEMNAHISDVMCIIFYPKDRLASGSKDKSICIWEVSNSNYKFLKAMSGHTSDVNSLAFFSLNTQDSGVLASGSKDKSVRLWDISNSCCKSVMTGHTDGVNGVAFGSEGKILVSVSQDKSVRLWNTRYKALNTVNEHTDKVKGIAINSDMGILASASSDQSVRLWDAEGKFLYALKEHTQEVNSVALSMDGKLLASGSSDNSVCIWNTEGKLLYMLKEHKSSIRAIVFNPINSNILASASGGLTREQSDNTIRLWDITDKPVCLCAMAGHTSRVTSITFSSDGKLLASGSWDKSIRIWDVLTRKNVWVINGHNDTVNCIAFSPDKERKILASGSSDKLVCLWDISNPHKPLLEMKGHTNEVNCVAFSLDGRILASGSSDNSVRFWDGKTGKLLNSLKLTSPIYAIAFVFNEIDNKTYLSISSGKVIYYFETITTQSKFNFVLLWSVGNDSGLMSNQLDLGGVVGLDKQHDHLLKQREAIGNPSQKSTNAVLHTRNQKLVYQPPVYNVFGGHILTREQATVTMARKKTGEGSIHAFLIIEYIESNYYTIIRCDLVLDLKQKHVKKLVALGQALIEICTKPLKDMQILATECVYKCWEITYLKAKELLDNVEADRKEPIAYLNLGNSLLYSAINPNQRKHSCLTWCEEHLTKISIDVSKQQSWKDVFVANTINHLPDEDSSLDKIETTSTLSQVDKKDEEPDSPSNCFMM